MNDVDIILPTYNCDKYIEETLNSVVDQSFQNWSLIIIDDASIDNTTNLIKKYLSDQRIKLKIIMLYMLYQCSFFVFSSFQSNK